MVQYIGDVLLPVVNKDKLVVVPGDGEVALPIILNDTINELLRLVADVTQGQRNLEGLLVVVHLDEVDACVRANHDLVGLHGHLQGENVPNTVELL